MMRYDFVLWLCCVFAVNQVAGHSGSCRAPMFGTALGGLNPQFWRRPDANGKDLNLRLNGDRCKVNKKAMALVLKYHTVTKNFGGGVRTGSPGGFPLLRTAKPALFA